MIFAFSTSEAAGWGFSNARPIILLSATTQRISLADQPNIQALRTSTSRPTFGIAGRFIKPLGVTVRYAILSIRMRDEQRQSQKSGASACKADQSRKQFDMSGIDAMGLSVHRHCIADRPACHCVAVALCQRRQASKSVCERTPSGLQGEVMGWDFLLIRTGSKLATYRERWPCTLMGAVFQTPRSTRAACTATRSDKTDAPPSCVLKFKQFMRILPFYE